jgi:hypothetical protein
LIPAFDEIFMQHESNPAEPDMVNRATWRIETDGHFSAEVRGLRLIVRKSDIYARYVILQCADHGGSSGNIMLSSGTEPSVEAVMVAAERVATRINLTLADRRRVNVPSGQRDHQQLGGANGQPLPYTHR